MLKELLFSAILIGEPQGRAETPRPVPKEQVQEFKVYADRWNCSVADVLKQDRIDLYNQIRFSSPAPRNYRDNVKMAYRGSDIYSLPNRAFRTRRDPKFS